MKPTAECPNFEVLFSKQGVILSFSCDDIPSIPGELKSVGWLADGWLANFEGAEGSSDYSIRFPGAPEDVLARVARHEKLLVVGLRKSSDPLSPEIALSQEVALPNR